MKNYANLVVASSRTAASILVSIENKSWATKPHKSTIRDDAARTRILISFEHVEGYLYQRSLQMTNAT